MIILYTIILALSAFIFAYVGSAGLALMFSKNNILTTDNSSEKIPYFGGMATLLAIISFSLIAGVEGRLIASMLVLGGLYTAHLSSPMSKTTLLAARFILSIYCVFSLNGLLLGGLIPELADKALAAVILFIFTIFFSTNSNNNSISISKILTICLGLIGLVFLNISGIIPQVKTSPSLAVDSLIILAGIIGFWLFNRKQNQLILGDIVNIPISLFLGFLLLKLAIGLQ